MRGDDGWLGDGLLGRGRELGYEELGQRGGGGGGGGRWFYLIFGRKFGLREGVCGT